MGIWDSVFGSANEASGEGQQSVRWNPLTESEELNALKEASFQRPQVIFKNSRSCGISGMTKRRFEVEAGRLTEDMDFHLLVIQKSRDLSAQIATYFQVRHESPQVLLVKDGVVVAHASHWQIDAMALEDYK